MSQSPWEQPVKSKSPEHLGLPVGQYAKVRKSLEEERKQEYKEYVEKVIYLSLSLKT